MRQKGFYFRSAVLLLVVLSIAPGVVNANRPDKIRGTVVGYIWDLLLLVRTEEKRFVVLRPHSKSSNPIPESVLRQKRVWEFAVTPARECTLTMSFFRFRSMMAECGTDYRPAEPPQSPEPTPAPYSPLTFFKPEFRKDLDAVKDETVLTCYEVDLARSSPDYKERLLTGVVANSENVPIPDFPVTVGFAGASAGYVFVLTDVEGKFSIPVYEKFSYWIKAGRTGIGAMEGYKPTIIPKNRRIPPLTLKLERE